MCKLSALLREGTANVHRRAEQTGIVRDMLNDRITATGYQLYLRNLYEIYSTLERHRQNPETMHGLGQLILPELCRARAIASDLSQLYKGDWQSDIQVLASAVAYRDRIERLAKEVRVPELMAHAYVRYLGDLSGGQMLGSQLARHPGLADEQLSFYRFKQISDLQAAKRLFRQALDDFGRVTPDPNQVLNEARHAFELNIELSVEAKKSAESAA